jgi:hypothetical protein
VRLRRPLKKRQFNKANTSPRNKHGSQEDHKRDCGEVSRATSSRGTAPAAFNLNLKRVLDVAPTASHHLRNVEVIVGGQTNLVAFGVDDVD